MSADRIPPDHLIHLLSRLSQKDRPADFQKLASKKDPAVRQELLAVIARCLGAKKKEQLVRAWELRGRTAVFMWSIHNLKDKSMAGVASTARQRLPNARAESATKFPGKVTEKKPVRLASLSLKKAIVSGRSEIFVKRKGQYEGTVVESDTSVPVRFRISLARPIPILEVYASQRFASATAQRVMVDVLGAVATEPSKDALSFLPVNPTENFVKDLIAKLQMVQIALSGKDGQGTLGEVAFEGRRSGANLEPLPISDARVKLQDAVSNRSRSYGFDYEHTDGYKERVQFTFAFSAKHSHVTFDVRTSNPAIQHTLKVIAERCLSGN